MSDFKCRVCGQECPIVPDQPGRAVCEEHCEGHDYVYIRGERRTACIHCDKEKEYEPLEDDIQISFRDPGRQLGTPLSELSTRPGEKGYEEWCRICRSWGYD